MNKNIKLTKQKINDRNGYSDKIEEEFVLIWQCNYFLVYM